MTRAGSAKGASGAPALREDTGARLCELDASLRAARAAAAHSVAMCDHALRDLAKLGKDLGLKRGNPRPSPRFETLKVEFADGGPVLEGFPAKEVFVDALEHMELRRVMGLSIAVRPELYALVRPADSLPASDLWTYRSGVDGPFLVFTKLSARSMASVIRRVAKYLQESVKVSVVSRHG